MEDIVLCAERWLALGKLPVVGIHHSEGYEDSDVGQEKPAFRLLALDLCTHAGTDEQDPHSRAIRLSKLTEMADLVRARELEDQIVRQQ
jgi:hypothetical protein